MPAPWGAVVALRVGFAALPAMAQPAGAPDHECDRLAQPPRQTMGRLPAFAEGVGSATLRAGPAWTACAQAMTAAPAEMRFAAYAARAADKGGDLREAARLYRTAADGGNVLAQNNLGAMIEAGEGALPRNPREAARLYRLRPTRASRPDRRTLARSMPWGGAARDDREAVRLFQMAAEQEDAQAQTGLGVMYTEGRGGLPLDSKEAARMWRLAADQGSVEARNNLRKLGVRN